MARFLPAGLAFALLALLAPLPPTSAAIGSETPLGDLTGQDGLVYPVSPTVTVGQDDYLFFGLDFDQACQYGTRLANGLRRLAQLAHVIERSGRKVVFTVAPGKSFVRGDELVSSQLPQGECDQVGIGQQDQVLDTFSDPAYLPVRRLLERHPGQTYWKTDPHWDGLGAEIYAKALAERLDPDLAREQHYRAGTYTAPGILATIAGAPRTETVPDPVPDNGVRSHALPGSPHFHGLPQIIFDYAWTSKPAAKTWPGRTALIADSFTLYGLRVLEPLFHRAHYLWIGHVPDAALVKAIRGAQTVVIEVAQWLLLRESVANNAFIAQVRAGLR